MTTNQELATTQTALQATQPGSYGIEGMEGLGQQDIVIPRWSICQPTSRHDDAENHVGEFRRNIDGQFAKSLDVVILQISPTRLLWSGDLTDRGPECASRDAVHGSTYGLCGQCDFNPQANPELLRDRREGLQVKICGYGYTYLLADDVENPNSMALFGAMGTSVRPAKTLHSQFMSRRRPPFSAIVHLGTSLEKNDKGRYYVLKADVAEWLDPETTAVWREAWQAISGSGNREFDESEAAAAAPSVAPVSDVDNDDIPF